MREEQSVNKKNEGAKRDQSFLFLACRRVTACYRDYMRPWWLQLRLTD